MPGCAPVTQTHRAATCPADQLRVLFLRGNQRLLLLLLLIIVVVFLLLFRQTPPFPAFFPLY